MIGRGYGRGFRGLAHGYPGGMYGRGFGLHPLVGPFLMLLVLAALAVAVYALWRAFEKAGLNGAWSLLALIPFVGLPAAALVLAFSEWPALTELARWRAHYASTASPAVANGPATETPVAPTQPMTPPDTVVPAAEPEPSSAVVPDAPTEPIAPPKTRRKPKGE